MAVMENDRAAPSGTDDAGAIQCSEHHRLISPNSSLEDRESFSHAPVNSIMLGNMQEGLMRGSRAPCTPRARMRAATVSIGYAPSVHDVCRQIHKPKMLRNAKRVSGSMCQTYVGLHRLVDRSPPDVVL